MNTLEIVGETFSNCKIIGPAVLVPLGSGSFIECSFDAPGTDAIFWEIPPERTVVVGAVAVIDCTFSRCSFLQIGLAGTRQLRDKLDQELGS